MQKHAAPVGENGTAVLRSTGGGAQMVLTAKQSVGGASSSRTAAEPCAEARSMMCQMKTPQFLRNEQDKTLAPSGENSAE
eukprot:5385382-Prymnesium_polylepis.2